MVSEILGAESFYDFLLDQYGNYVIQKSLSVAKEPDFTQFIEKLKPDIDRLRFSNEFGMKIYTRLIKQYPQLAIEGVKPLKGNYYKNKTMSGQKGKGQKKNKKKEYKGSSNQLNYTKSNTYQDEMMMGRGGKGYGQQHYDMYYNTISHPHNNVNISININANIATHHND
mmetsp:Transcript_25041/g.24503  ORF Transcript_25041/g.24503 Transcript_25041/m.24503 type:complete len:169 (+) Transcript_25041:2251-2757(+)